MHKWVYILNITHVFVWTLNISYSFYISVSLYEMFQIQFLGLVYKKHVVYLFPFSSILCIESGVIIPQELSALLWY